MRLVKSSRTAGKIRLCGCLYNTQPARDGTSPLKPRARMSKNHQHQPEEKSGDTNRKFSKKHLEKELTRLQLELVKLQEWIKQTGLKVVVLFEGRDAAGKGGVIKRITQCLNPRICRVDALAAPGGLTLSPRSVLCWARNAVTRACFRPPAVTVPRGFLRSKTRGAWPSRSPYPI